MTSGAPSNEWTGRHVHRDPKPENAHVEREVRAFALKLEPPPVVRWDVSEIHRALFDEVNP